MAQVTLHNLVYRFHRAVGIDNIPLKSMMQATERLETAGVIEHTLPQYMINWMGVGGHMGTWNVNSRVWLPKLREAVNTQNEIENSVEGVDQYQPLNESNDN